MSDKKINFSLLEDLDPNSFLGKVLTMPTTEITEYFKKDFPEPTQDQASAGSIGNLSMLEQALLTQASRTTAAVTQLTDDFMARTETEAFKKLDISEKEAQLKEITDTAESLSDEVHEYVEISQESTSVRFPNLAQKSPYTFICSDGNLYPLPTGADAPNA